jgi:hypothetical protein
MGGMFTPNTSSINPASVAAAWWAADDVTGANDSHPVSLVDRTAGLLATPQGATGGTLKVADWNGQKCMKQNAEAWRCTSPAVLSALAGGENWWVLIVGMMLANAGAMKDQTIWSAGSSTDAQKYMALRETPATGSQSWVQRFGAAAQTADDSAELQGPFPYLWLLRCDGAGVHTFSRDGLIEQTFARSTGGALNVDAFLIGGLMQGAGAPAIDSLYQWRHVLVGAPGLDTPANITKLFQYFANDSQGLSWKRGLTGGQWTGTTYIFPGGPQQSNGQGQGAAPYDTVTAQNAKALFFNSFVGNLADPWASNAGTPFTSVFINSGLGSAVCSWANTLWANGEYGPNDAVFFIPSGVGGSSLGSFWVPNANVSPPPWTAAMGAWKLRLAEVYRNAPNPVIRRVWWRQGESESLVLLQAQQWGDVNRAQLLRTTIESFATAQGYSWYDATHHIVEVLPPTAWTSGTFWADVIVSQQAFAAAFPDCVAYQSVDGPWTDASLLHLNRVAQTADGVLLGGL